MRKCRNADGGTWMSRLSLYQGEAENAENSDVRGYPGLRWLVWGACGEIPRRPEPRDLESSRQMRKPVIAVNGTSGGAVAMPE